MKKPLFGFLVLALIVSVLLAAPCPRSFAEQVLADNGSVLGQLRQLSDFPLYELRYEAPYNVVGPYTPVSAASAERPFACTLFSATDASGNRVMGRNFDWRPNPVMVVITKPAGGYASVSLVDMSYPVKLDDMVRWPFDGMNERGLAVGMMLVDEARSTYKVGMPAVTSFGIIRVLLDKAATLDEAIALMGQYLVGFGILPIHYFVADRRGAAATIEYFRGKLQVFREKRPWQVSANLLFSRLPESERIASCWRYALAARRLAATDGQLDGKGVFGLLEAVSESSTVWSSSYDLTNARLELALGRDYARTFSWSLDEITGND
jgi:hypothetical protein